MTPGTEKTIRTAAVAIATALSAYLGTNATTVPEDSRESRARIEEVAASVREVRTDADLLDRRIANIERTLDSLVPAIDKIYRQVVENEARNTAANLTKNGGVTTGGH